MVRAASVCMSVGNSSGSGDVTGHWSLGNDDRKRIRLTKKLTSKSGSGFISENSQFPSVGRVTHWIFAFLAVGVGFFVLGLGSVMLMNQRELAENQVAQSHASR